MSAGTRGLPFASRPAHAWMITGQGWRGRYRPFIQPNNLDGGTFFPPIWASSLAARACEYTPPTRFAALSFALIASRNSRGPGMLRCMIRNLKNSERERNINRHRLGGVQISGRQATGCQIFSARPPGGGVFELKAPVPAQAIRPAGRNPANRPIWPSGQIPANRPRYALFAYPRDLKIIAIPAAIRNVTRRP
jgi:hypothetical protein